MRLSRRAVILAGGAGILLFLSHRRAYAEAEKLKVDAELSTSSVKTAQSNLACIVADAVRSATAADIAFLTASSFSDTTIPKGTATVEDVLRALAFRNDPVVVVRLTGDKVKQALEHALALHPQKHVGFLQVAGLTVTIDPSQARGQRIASVKVGPATLSDSKEYLVAMPLPLAEGGLQYYKIWSKGQIAKDKDPKLTLEEAVGKYLKDRSSLNSGSEERIVFKK